MPPVPQVPDGRELCHVPPGCGGGEDFPGESAEADERRLEGDLIDLEPVVRDAMAVDSLDPSGVYFGTTGGQVYASADGGDSWAPIVRDLPSVVSVEAQTLP